ncbi:8-oxo-dGTP diphosphatase [Patescibacteria group bacterium]|nr:MAG: 8-oxo-dGTP diphosphatase [Patescibacteria group bacterium]
MKQTNLCFLKKGDQILLAMKKRGFGVGKWNGVGGKVAEGETVEQSTIRETREEIGVVIAPNDLKKVADLYFTFVDKEEWNQQCSVYMTSVWKGEPTESEEMKPGWYDTDKLPYEKMWIDDPHWLPLVIAGEIIEAHFIFNQKGEIAGSFEVKKVS